MKLKRPPFWRDTIWLILLWGLVTMCVGCGWSTQWRWTDEPVETIEEEMISGDVEP